jgi:hypothetical protein
MMMKILSAGAPCARYLARGDVDRLQLAGEAERLLAQSP